MRSASSSLPSQWMKKWPLSCSCRSLWGARPRLVRAGDEEFDSHPAATLFMTGACWLTSAQWMAKSNKKLPLPSPAPPKPSNRHCMASHKCHWTEGCLPQCGKVLKSPRAKSGNGMTPNEPYLGIRGLLEFGGGVRTPPPDLRFRNLLKSATWQFSYLYPSGTSAKDPTCHQFRVEISS